MYLELRLNLTRLSLGQDLQVTRDLTKDRAQDRGWEEKGKEKEKGCDYRGEGRVDSVGTNLDAGLVFSYPLTCQNLNVTRHLWSQGCPHERTHIHRVILTF